ncbi:MAG: CoA transferase [Microbacterium sp.]
MSGGALAGLRVADLATDISGSYCARLLADLGADVIRLEHVSADVDESRLSGEFAYLNQNKRSVAIDVDQQAGQDIWRRLVDAADVVIDTGNPGALSQRGVSLTEFAECSPRAIVVSITPFGLTGPYRLRPASDLTVAALGGLLKSLGDSRREPLSVGFPLVQFVSGVIAAVGVLAAWRQVDDDPGARLIEVSQQEVALRLPLYPTVAARVGHATGRRTPFPMYVQTSNGYAAVNALSAQHFRDAMTYMGLDEIAEDRAMAADSSLRESVAPQLQERMDAWAADKTREEIFHVGQAMRIPTGIPYTLLEVLEEDHYRARDFFRPLATSGTVVQQPVGPISGSTAARTEWTDAPALGEHSAAVLEEWLDVR